MNGAVIYCAAAGRVCVDAVGTSHVSWNSLNVVGSRSDIPSIGFQIGRLGATTDCAEQRFDRPKITGYFTLTAMLNVACETTVFIAPHIENDYPGAGYAYVADGLNHFHLRSEFVAVTLPTNSANSFDENVFVNATIVGQGAVSPIWFAGTIRHRWIGSYELASASRSGVSLFDDRSQSNQMLMFDTHIEGSALDHAFLVTGPNATPQLLGFQYDDQKSQARSSYFKLDKGVTSAAIVDAQIHILQAETSLVSLFDKPEAWSVSGVVQLGSGTPTQYWQLAKFDGRFCHGDVCSTVFDDRTDTRFRPSWAKGVSKIDVTVNSNFVPTAKGLTFPAIRIDAPPLGGSQAVAHVSSMQASAYPTVFYGGSGYRTGDRLILGAGLVCKPEMSVEVVQTSSFGSIKKIRGVGSPDCSVIATDKVLAQGGTGHGALFILPNFRIAFRETYSGVDDIAIDLPGNGYVDSPKVLFIGGNPASAVARLMSDPEPGSAAVPPGFTNPAVLGNTGSHESSVVNKGAIVDGTGIRCELGSTFTVPENTSLVRFTQAHSVSESMVILPTARADGQVLQFVNYDGTIGALRFSPSVRGWADGTKLSAFTGMRIRWDASAFAWYREQ